MKKGLTLEIRFSQNIQHDTFFLSWLYKDSNIQRYEMYLKELLSDAMEQDFCKDSFLWKGKFGLILFRFFSRKMDNKLWKFNKI